MEVSGRTKSYSESSRRSYFYPGSRLENGPKGLFEEGWLICDRVRLSHVKPNLHLPSTSVQLGWYLPSNNPSRLFS